MSEVIAEYKVKVAGAVSDLDSAAKSWQKVDSASVKAGADGSQAMNKVGQSAKTAESSLKKMATNTGNSFKRMGGQILAALGVGSAVFALVSAMKGLIDINKNFELQMARVKAITGATDEEFKSLTDNAKLLGATTKFTATEVGGLQEEYAKLGFKTEEIVKATESTLLLAEATGSDLAQAANIAGQVLRAFGLDASETQRVVDVMAKSFSSSALNMENFQESMKFVAPIASVANISLETTTSLLAKLADAGLRGSIAGTGLKNLLSRLADENSSLSKEIGFAVKNSEDLFNAFDKLKNGNIDLTKATELTDERSKAAFLTLISGADDLRTLSAAFDDAKGSAEDMALIMRDTLSGDIDQLKAKLEGLALALGEGEGGLAIALRRATQNWGDYIGMLTRAALSTDQLINNATIERVAELNKEISNSNLTIDEQIKAYSELAIAEIDRYQSIVKRGGATDDLNESMLSEIYALNQITTALRKAKEQEAALTEEKDRAAKADVISIRNIAFLKTEVERLKKEQDDATKSRKENIATSAELKAVQQELAILYGKETDEQKKLREQLELNAKLRSQVFTGAEMAEGIPIVIAMSSTIKGLNDLLKEQKKILEESPEFSEQYSDAIKAIDELETKLDEFNDDYIDPEKGFLGASTDGFINTDLQQEQFDNSIDMFQQYASAVGDIADGISNAIQAGHAAELSSLESQLDQGIISREEYDKKRRNLERKAAIDQKNAAIFQSIINTALAVSSALTVAPPAGYILAGISAALGAVEIGVIASQPLPAFAKGVIGLKGEGTETSDSIHAKLSKGESVMTAKETKNYESELWAMRRGTFDQLIMAKYVKPMINESVFNGFADIGKSAELNGLTATLKDHNIIAGLDRLRQSQSNGFKFLAKEMSKNKQPKRGGYV